MLEPALAHSPTELQAIATEKGIPHLEDVAVVACAACGARGDLQAALRFGGFAHWPGCEAPSEALRFMRQAGQGNPSTAPPNTAVPAGREPHPQEA